MFLTAAPVFTSPSHQNFLVILSGWICCSGRHTVTRVIQAAGARARRKHFSVYYRFLSRAQWCLDELGRVLFGLILPWVPGERILVIVDDTLCKKSGPHIFGAGMHHDASRSTYGRGSGRRVSFRFGHRFVVLSIWVPRPWNPEAGFALPVLFRLYRPKKRTPESQYAKATELARELVEVFTAWVPEDRKLTVTADCEYACRTLVRALPQGVEFAGPVLSQAALYEPPQARRRGTYGRPRKRGRRLPSIESWAERAGERWKHTELSIYGKPVRVQIKARVCLWYRVAYTRPVQVVLVRDPRGRLRDQAYFSTDLSLTAEEIPVLFSRRWSLEVTFRDAKQHLGLEDAQNGWWRRSKRERRRKKKAGPQPHARRGARAAWRTGPIALASYTFVCLWYFEHGKVSQDVRRARQAAPWYRHKRWPSFEDMLGAARREFWLAEINRHPSRKEGYRLIRHVGHLLGFAA
jgi:hypothetical protein